MSGFTANLITSNILDELDLNPPWEKSRAHLLIASIVCGTFTVYMTAEGFSSSCVPSHSSRNGALGPDDDKRPLTESETAYVNGICSNGYTGVSQGSGILMLMLGIVIYVLSTYWLHNRSAIRGFRHFDEARQKLCDLNMSLKSAITLNPEDIRDDKDKRSDFLKVKAASDFLTESTPNKKLFTRYIVRSIGLIVGVLLYQYFPILLMLELHKYQNTYDCQLQNLSLNTEVNEDFPNHFSCSIQGILMTEMVLYAFICTCFLQAACLIWGLIVIRRRMCKYPGNRSLKLLFIFSEYSSIKNSKALKQLAQDLLQKKQDVNNVLELAHHAEAAEPPIFNGDGALREI